MGCFHFMSHEKFARITHHNIAFHSIYTNSEVPDNITFSELTSEQIDNLRASDSHETYDIPAFIQYLIDNDIEITLKHTSTRNTELPGLGVCYLHHYGVQVPAFVYVSIPFCDNFIRDTLNSHFNTNQFDNWFDDEIAEVLINNQVLRMQFAVLVARYAIDNNFDFDEFPTEFGEYSFVISDKMSCFNALENADDLEGIHEPCLNFVCPITDIQSAVPCLEDFVSALEGME